jgi:protein-disulfide isomerase
MRPRRALSRGFAALAAAVLLVSMVALGGGLAGCGSSSNATGGAGSATAQDVALPGVDTSDFTPRERHEFSEYVTQLPSPCNDVAVPIAQCVLEKRACATCLPAAQAIAKAVREGMVREQVEALYKQRFDAATAKTIPLDGSPSRGPENAQVFVVEFADFECPFCQKIAPELDALWDKRKDSVRFVYKFMPLQMHPHAEPAARAAIAAMNQGKFWEMHHQLFANGQHLEPADIDAYAKAIGLDLDRFHADMESPATKARLDSDKKLGDDLGVKGTPTIFIDGHEYDSKIDLGDWLDQEIAAHKR